MGISISPSGILKLFIDNKHRSKDKVADYLDSIAAEARRLAEVWEQARIDVVHALTQRSGQTDDGAHSRLRLMGAPNAPSFYRLKQFYQQVRQVTEGKCDPESQENFVSHLNCLLTTRDITLDSFREALRGIRHSVFVDDESAIEDFHDLATLCESLHREAAAIDVLAKGVRALDG